MSKNFYVTTPIYYVNDVPHLGHAYTTLACDIIARFKRLAGYNVMFLTGTDEHGQKVAKAANDKNISSQEFTDNISLRFKDLVKGGANLLNISNDDFIRTTQERHKIACRKIWQKMLDNGHIYLGEYEGWYCLRDEAFYQESELIDGNAPTGASVELIKQKSYFFNLSQWQDKLLQFYEDNPDFVVPASRYNEVKSFVRGGKEYKAGALKDLSISRVNFDWGVKVPDDENHVMYVWVDALTNYLTALGYPDESSQKFQDFWVNGDNSPLHVVGKDILRFHAVYWPAFLMAAELALPKRIIAHGWWTIEGQKMSKSLGNVVAPADLVAEFGLDQIRYFLFKEVPFGMDGNFVKENIITGINADLANNIGNLAQRTLSMVNKNCDSKIPQYDNFNEDDKKLLDLIYINNSQEFDELDELINYGKFDVVISNILKISTKANEYIDSNAPWQLKKTDIARMNSVLYILCEAIRSVAIRLQPFTPDACAKLLDILNIKDRDFKYLNKENAFKPGHVIEKAVAIFPRLEINAENKG